jgi:hypothetical protein
MLIRPFLAAYTITLGWIALGVSIAGFWVRRRFANDLGDARTRSALGSVVVQTRCGPIEVRSRLGGASRC